MTRSCFAQTIIPKAGVQDQPQLLKISSDFAGLYYHQGIYPGQIIFNFIQKMYVCLNRHVLCTSRLVICSIQMYAYIKAKIGIYLALRSASRSRYGVRVRFRCITNLYSVSLMWRCTSLMNHQNKEISDTNIRQSILSFHKVALSKHLSIQDNSEGFFHIRVFRPRLCIKVFFPIQYYYFIFTSS